MKEHPMMVKQERDKEALMNPRLAIRFWRGTRCGAEPPRLYPTGLKLNANPSLKQLSASRASARVQLTSNSNLWLEACEY